MIEIIKTTIKLLVRNMGFWFFLIISPFLSILCLKAKQENIAFYDDMENNDIAELKSVDTKVAYYGGNGKYVVKIYDSSDSELSEYFLNKLLECGAFKVCRVKTPDMTKTDVDSHMKFDGFDDRMGAALYLSPDFDKQIMSGDINSAFTVYVLSDDERYLLLEDEIKTCIGQINQAVMLSAKPHDKAQVIEILNEMNKELPQKNVKSIAGKNKRELTNEQNDMMALMGYAFALLTLGFVFGGVFIAHTTIKERKDMVFTRLKLTNISDAQYFTSKFICAVIVSLMLTIVMGIFVIIFKVNKMGINTTGLLFMIFLMGLIFNSASMLIGIIMGDVMGANVAAFTMWCLTALLSGLYFPLNYTTTALKALSHMMPQKWFLEGTEMIFVGDNKAFPMLICITAAYLIVILSLGSLGLKIRRTDSWGNS